VDARDQVFAHALEDLPEEVRQEAALIARVEPGISLGQRIVDEVETAGLDLFGTLEESPLLSFLSRYPVTPYTYRVSEVVSRGQRPDAAKLTELAAQGCRATVNLCAEVTGGDVPMVIAARLSGTLRTYHIPVTDMEAPTTEQVLQLLDLLSGPAAEPTYVHCEAGKGRTGVAVACYRMAVSGWSAANALTEAVNFGCSVPGQQAFILEFGGQLAAGPVAGRYPLRPLGSVKPTTGELTATLRTAAG
jgi:hypothetical protein